MICRDPLDHYDIGEDDDCSCRYCNDWRVGRYVADKARMMFNARRCKCKNCAANPNNTIWKCASYMRAHNNHLAAANRRELWIEMSYHAKHGAEQDGRELMEWLDRTIRSMSLTKRGTTKDGWWAFHSERLTLDYWFCRFDNFVRAKEIAKLAVDEFMVGRLSSNSARMSTGRSPGS